MRFPCRQTREAACPCAGAARSGGGAVPTNSSWRPPGELAGWRPSAPAAPQPRPGTHLGVCLQLSVPVVNEVHDGVHRRGRVEVVRQRSLHSVLGVAEPGGTRALL